MPWVPSFLFLSFLYNRGSYGLIAQHLLNFEGAARHLRTLSDRDQASVGMVDTAQRVRPALTVAPPLPTKDLGHRHRGTVPYSVGSLLIHQGNWKSVQRYIQRQQILSQPTKGMTSDHLIDCQRLIDRQRAHSPSLQRQHVAADAQRFPDVGTQRSP